MKTIRWLAPVLVALLPVLAVAQVVEPGGGVVEPAASAEAAPGGEGQPAATPTPAVAPRKICRTEAVTGSSMKRRVCQTQEQVEADRDAARNLVNDGRSFDSSGNGIR
jgi:hypothetical protein